MGKRDGRTAYCPGEKVLVWVDDACPERLSSHGLAELVNDKAGLVLGEAPGPRHGHTVKVGLPEGFSYFTASELELIAPSAQKGTA